MMTLLFTTTAVVIVVDAVMLEISRYHPAEAAVMQLLIVAPISAPANPAAEQSSFLAVPLNALAEFICKEPRGVPGAAVPPGGIEHPAALPLASIPCEKFPLEHSVGVGARATAVGVPPVSVQL